MTRFSSPRCIFGALTVLTALFAAAYLQWALHSSVTTDRPPRLSTSLAAVPVVPQRVSIIGYKRQAFGMGWGAAHTLGPSCTTRELIIASAGIDVALSPGCDLLSGTAVDPYAGSVLTIGTTPIEVDHVFPLRAAWDMGAYAWDAEKRISFANDPINLIATSKGENQEKSDKLPSEWLPSDGHARCWYSRRLAHVAATYSLPLPRADVRVMRQQCWVRELLGR